MKPLADQRFSPSRPHARPAARRPGRVAAVAWAAWATLVLPACSGSGGGNRDSTPPRLIAAAFVGSGSPSAGEQLVLSFSEDVTATAGAEFGATQVTLSGADTLASASTVQDQPTARTVRILLGAGVSFTAGATTIDLATTNNVVADTAGNLGQPSTAVVIGTSDGIAPTVTNLTLNAIDGLLNGTGPAGGTLQVPQNGFVIDLAYTDTGTPTALGVDPARTQITANVNIGSTSGIQVAGTNLLPLLTQVTATSSVGSYRVPATMTFGPGATTLTALVIDAGGLPSATATFSFTVHAWTDALRPFETTTNAQQVWFLDTARDLESFTTASITGGATVNIVTVANGRSDFLDILYVLGLQATAPIAVGSSDSNTVVLDRFKTAILDNLALMFAGANVTFTFTQPTGSFGSNSSVAYQSLGYSQICLGGSDDSASLDILGIAQLDPSNTRQNNDCLVESATTSRLGVFLHTMADFGLAPPSNSAFRLAFNPFCPAVGGQAIGEAASDDLRLQGTLTDTRSIRLDSAIDGLARFIAVVTAHECGHSMGLVTTGPMPTGLYGGDSTNFPGSTDGHIRTQALFTSGGTNIMSPQLNYDLAGSSQTAFNSLNLAYLREQAFYGN